MNLNFSGVLQNADLLLWGTWYTVFTAILAIILGLILGTILFLGMQSGSRIIRGLVAVYGSFVRGTPALVQIFVFLLCARTADWSGYRSGDCGHHGHRF